MSGGPPVSSLDSVYEAIDRGVQRTNSSGDRASEARSVATAIRDALGCRWVGIYTVTPRVVRILGWTGSEPPDHPTFERGLGLTGVAISSRQIVVSNDVARDDRYLSAFATTGSELIAPILGDEGVPIGTLDLEDAEVGAFSEIRVEAARGLARALAHLVRPARAQIADVDIEPWPRGRRAESG